MTKPSCSYRIQFNRNFTFKHLLEILDYLEELGITAIYASPILKATAGSDHGYDGTDPSVINPEIGTLEEFKTVAARIKAKGMQWIQDIVPNHLAFDTTNVWLNDVLERGINSSFANYFDIDWNHPSYPGKLMAPFLGESLTESIVKENVQLRFNESGFFIKCYSSLYPVNIESYSQLIAQCVPDEMSHVNATLSALVNNINTTQQHWTSLKQELLKQLTDGQIVKNIRQKVDDINKNEERLLQLLSSQYYVLCTHKESFVQINYRRFFNVNQLICLRVEDEQVFADYHRLIYDLYKEGHIQGLRIDHIDGLKSPRNYLHRLRELFGEECYIIVEKILDVKEDLPENFGIQGTSGYEFLSYINQVITDRKGSEKLLALYNHYVPQFSDYDTMVFLNKLDNLESYLNGEWDNLLRLLLSLNIIQDEEIRMQKLKMALGVFMAAFPVYRAYIDEFPLTEKDFAQITRAFDAAVKRHPELKYELATLNKIFKPGADENRNNNSLLFIQRLMQFTGPLAAKGVEDCTFYRYNALISHNEVGDNPCMLGIPVKTFHEKMEQRKLNNPFSFNCTSTHDTKRGEDARIRINLLSEFTEEWLTLVEYWRSINKPFKQQVENVMAPILNDEYFFYQSFIGAFPQNGEMNQDFRDRTKTYFIKALREAKVMTGHIRPNVRYENACLNFTNELLNPDNAFLESFAPFVKKIIAYANIYSMEQVIIKATVPGIPDIYRGCELWDNSYVDPDNRRPVNYPLRKSLLATLTTQRQKGIAHLLKWAKDNWETGAQKLFVTNTVLQLRKKYNDVFLKGDYIPVYAEGGDRVVIAYLRHYQKIWILVVLPLGIVANTGKPLTLILPESAPAKWQNIFTLEDIIGNAIEINRMYDNFPVAVLINLEEQAM